MDKNMGCIYQFLLGTQEAGVPTCVPRWALTQLQAGLKPNSISAIKMSDPIEKVEERQIKENAKHLAYNF